MEENKRRMKIKAYPPVSTSSVPPIKVVDENDEPVPGREISLEQLLKELEGKIIEMQDCKLIYTHSSPGCIYFYMNGVAYKICD